MSSLLWREREVPASPGTRTALGRLPDWSVERVSLAVLWLAIIGYVLVFLDLTFRLFDRFTIMAYDLGIFDQAAWLISRGRAPFVSVRGLPLMADHFSAILYLLAPLYHFWPTPKTLLAAQTLALAAGARPVYALARERKASAPLAALFGIAYLLYPPMQWTNAFEFHPEAFATPLFLAAFLFLARRQWLPYFLALTLALLTKENAGLTVISLGVYAWVKADRRAGAGTMVLGAAGLLIGILTVRAFNGGAPSPFFSLYGHFGHGPAQMALFALRHPLALAAVLTDHLNRTYLVLEFFPLFFLLLLAPGELLIALPALLTNMLSSRYVMHTIAHQYTAFITPFVFVAAVEGAARVRRLWGGRATRPVAVFLCACAGLTWAQSPLVVWHGRVRPGLTPSRVPEVRRMLALIPPQASVSAQGTLMAHLAHRQRVYPFPNPFVPVASGYGARALQQMELKDYAPETPDGVRRAFASAPVEYVALCPRTTTYPLTSEMYPVYAVAMLQSPSYGIVAIGVNGVLLRRGADHGRGLSLLARQTHCPVRTDEDVRLAFFRWTRTVPFVV